MPLAPYDIDYLCTAIQSRSGNQISASQSYLLEARLAPIAQSAGLPNVEALVAHLRNNPRNPLHEQITEAMTINETSFFRDIQPFEVLKAEILPTLATTRRTTRSLSIWSAACSSGQEAYSIAMLIRNEMPSLNSWNIRILCTDLSDEMVRRTRDGVYSQFEVNRGLPAQMLLRWFNRSGLQWQVKPELRQLIEARKMNLTENWSTLTQHDVVFLRNVLIYFDRRLKEQILRRIHQAMRPDGILFLGGGETLLQLNVPFERITVGKTVCFRPVAV
ncbi:MAG: protein-glutamate O-methyltransferase CheR [Planctomycetaceae bacterium]|nr:protein-glutamate O-methyltransferase CheR [Planctomycetaceae bacterium]